MTKPATSAVGTWSHVTQGVGVESDHQEERIGANDPICLSATQVAIKISYIQLSLEQHRFELHGSTYMQMFFNTVQFCERIFFFLMICLTFSLPDDLVVRIQHTGCLCGSVSQLSI